MSADLYFEGTHYSGAQLAEAARALGRRPARAGRAGRRRGRRAAAQRSHLCRHRACLPHGRLLLLPDQLAFHHRGDPLPLSDSGAKVLIAHADLLEAARDAVPAGVTVLALAPGRHGEAGAAGAPGVRDYELAARAAALRRRAWRRAATWPIPRAPPAGQGRAARAHPAGAARRAAGADALGGRADHGRGGRLPRADVGAAVSQRPGVFIQNALQVAERPVLTPRFDPEQVLALVQEHRIDVLYPGAHHVRAHAQGAAGGARALRPSSLRFVASTGAPCAPRSSAP